MARTMPEETRSTVPSNSADGPVGHIAPETLKGRRPIADELHERYYEKAFKAVIDSGKRRIEDVAELVESLVEKARREVRLLGSREYDPNKNAADGIAKSEHEDRLTLRKDGRQALEQARAARLDAEHKRDALLPERAIPHLNPVAAGALLLASAIVLALTFKPLIGDPFFPDDAGKAWFVAYLLSIITSGAFLVTPLVTVSLTASREWINVLRMIVEAVLTGTALYFLRRRFIASDDEGGSMMNVGLMIFEGTIILICEGYCAFLRGKWRERNAWLNSWAPAEAKVATWTREQARCEQELTALRGEIDGHHASVKTRTDLAAQATDLEEAVDAATRAGALAAVEKMHGIVVGNQWQQPTVTDIVSHAHKNGVA